MSTTSFVQAKAPTQAPHTTVVTPMAAPPIPVQSQVAPAPDIATQLDRAARLGHNLGGIRIQGRGSVFVQPKLRLGPVGDRYEQEADHVASMVVQRLALPNQQPLIQREGTDEKQNEEPVQPKLMVQREATDEKKDEEPVQPKLLVQREAMDEKKDEEPVQAKPMVQREATDEKKDEEPVQAKLLVQREAMDEKKDEEPVQPKLLVQREAMDEKKDEEPVQAKPMVQREAMDEKKDEEPVQPKLLVQREAMDEKKDEEPVQAKLLVQREAMDEKKDEEPVQAKLLVQREAMDEKQDEEPVQTKLLVQREAMDEKKDEEPIQAKPMIQREAMDEKQDEAEKRKGVQAKVSIQRQASDEKKEPAEEAQAAPDHGSAGPATANGIVAPHVEASIHSARGGGQALAGGTQTRMEQAFGVDFGRVKIHTDARADSLNQSLSARAFTTGQDIFFRHGEYSPESTSGQQLLAHELTHVLQQSGRGQALQRARQERLQPAPRNLIQAKLASPSAPVPALVPAPAPAAEEEKKESTPTQNGAAPTTAANAPATEPAAAAAETTEAAPQSTEEPVAGAEPAGAPAADGAPTEGAATPMVGTVTPENAAAAGAEATAAVAAADAAGAAPVAIKTPASPAEDPAFQAVVGKVKGVASRQRKHAPARAKAKEAQAAAVSPASEISGKARGNQVGKMAQAEAPGFNAAAFKKQLMDRIQALTPRTAEAADEFKASNKLGGLKSEMQGKVAQERTASQTPLAKTTTEAPETSSVAPKPVAPLIPAAPGPAPADLGAGQAAPKAKGPAEVEAPFKADSVALDQQMAKGGVSEEQLAGANEPDFSAALGAKQAAQQDAQSAPKLYRQAEKAQLGQAAGEATQVTKQRIGAMHGDRAQLLKAVTGQQDTSKSQDEQARAKIGQDLAAIYETSKATVETILSELDGKVTQAFDGGAASAKQLFEDHVDREMKAYKAKRYGGFGGDVLWAKDKFFDLPDEVNRFYEDGRNLYLEKMDAVINTVVDIIGSELTRAKAEVAKGRADIQKYLATKVPEDLKQVGEDAAKGIQGRFDELEQSVDAKQGALVDLLANKYNEHLKVVDDRIGALKEANKGFVSKAMDAVGGVIKTILELKDMLLSVLARAAAAIGKIIKHPIEFLGHLINGVKLGLSNFVGNIGTHLQQGLINWLTGAIGGAGITLPKNFDLPGIFQLVMQILGLSFDKIMGKVSQVLGFDIMSFFEPAKQIIAIYQAEGLIGLAKHGLTQLIGEAGVKALLDVVEIFQALVSGEWGKIWKIVSGYLESLKEMVFGKIEEFISERVIKAGITWVISLLNPAGAFIKACKAIYDIIMFFVERGKQIMALVNAVIDSVAALADGNIGVAATAVENALARAIPVAIGFLASLLGLGNVSEKVQEIIQGVRGMVDKALDAVFNSKPVQMVAGFIKKAIAKIKSMVKAGVNWVKGKVKGEEEKKKAPMETVEQETPNSAAVKTKAHDLLSKRTNQPFETQEALEQTVGQVLKELKPEGLKALTLKPKENHPGEYNIIAEASPGSDVGDATVVLALPQTQVTYNMSSGKAGKVIASPLTKIPGNTQGSSPGETMIPGWKHAQTLNKQKQEWVRMHLLSEKLHGPGATWNLVPGRAGDNRNMELNAEKDAKNRISKNEVLFYEVSVSYHSDETGFSERGYFPSAISVTWGSMTKAGETYQRGSDMKDWSTDLQFPPKDPGSVTVNFNTDGRVNLERFAGCSRNLAEHIVKERKENGLFTESDFEPRMKARLPTKFEIEWRSMVPALLAENVKLQF